MAPTVKLHDDAPVRVPTPVPGAMNLGHLPTPAPGSLSYPPRPASIPPQNHNPASIPPQNHNPASIPPQNNPISRPPSAPVTGPPSQGPSQPSSQPPSQPPRRASTPAPTALSSPSLSMIAPKRSGALIAVVLVLDLALAAAGATLLVKGLAKPKAADAKPASATTHAQASAPAPEPVAVASAAAAPAGSAVAAADPPAPSLPPAADKTIARDPKKKTTAKPDPRDAKKQADRGPLDPYGGAAPPAPAADRSAEIDGLARQSFGAFRRCFDDAIHSQPIHGDIRIAFVVQPDGHVDHAAPVVNTTGSDGLASCLAQTIGAWTFAPHEGAAATYERPFNYP